MLRALLTALTLFVLWWLMSGINDPLLIWLGIGSSIIAVLIMRRMDKAADAEMLRIQLKPVATVLYWLWLMVEIAKANWMVAKIILSPAMSLNRHVFKVPYTQKTDLGQTIFANSITLTPGTISVEVEKDYFWVHAVAYTPDDMAALADMDAHVSAIESAGA